MLYAKINVKSNHFLFLTSLESPLNKGGSEGVWKYRWLQAKIPDYSLTAQGSLLNKDYLKLNEGVDEPLFLVGTPAKIKGKGLKKRIMQCQERQIDQFFYENDTASYMDGKGYNYIYQDL